MNLQLLSRSIVRYYSMSITVLVGLFFNIIIESRRTIIVGGLYSIPADIGSGKTIGAHKLTLLNVAIRILSKLSMAIFCLQGLYPEIKSPLITEYPSNK
jgi:hypothetical protein